jgi:hypothetical protein
LRWASAVARSLPQFLAVPFPHRAGIYRPLTLITYVVTPVACAASSVGGDRGGGPDDTRSTRFAEIAMKLNFGMPLTARP